MKNLFLKTLSLVLFLGLLNTSLFDVSHARVQQAGHCWNDKIGWINMGAVDYIPSTRTISGNATWFEGRYTAGAFADGDLEFTKQSGTSLQMTLSSAADGNGNFSLQGQAFSAQIGWVFADHGGTDPAAVTADGELTGNFWNNKIGWINCTDTDIGTANVHIFDLNNPNLIDSDGDGVPDSIETSQGTNPNDNTDHIDSDGDGHPDYVEDQAGSDPNLPGSIPSDTDGDGIPDVVETLQGTDPNIASDYRDSDGDGVSNYVESLQDTSANDRNDYQDTDGDGHADQVEDQAGSDPNLPGSTPTDTDNDGVPDVIEAHNGTDPNVDTDFLDTDGDGVPNYIEVLQGTDPNDINDNLDTDGDGVPDYIETNIDGTDPNVAGDVLDSEPGGGDGVPDYIEDLGFNNGDANGDGTPDRLQQNVASVRNAVTGGGSAIEVTGGCSVIEALKVEAESVMAAQDPFYDFPVGLVNFKLACANPGDSAQVEIFYDQAYSTTEWSFRKFTAVTNVYIDLGSNISVSIGSETVGGAPVTKITYNVEDGQSLTDDDGNLNSEILDPAGPAVYIAGGGSPKQIHPIGMCSKSEKQCQMRSPHLKASAGTSFSDYAKCLQSGSTMPNDCAKDWAKANQFQTCNTDNECPIPTAEAAIEMVQSAFKSQTEEERETECKTESFLRLKDNRLMGVPPGTFPDIDPNDRGYVYAVDLGAQDIIHGDSNTRNARLDDPISRAEIVKVLSRAASHDVVYGDCIENEFNDVQAGAWYHRYVENMRKRGVVDGYPSGVYKPSENINLAELYKVTALTFEMNVRVAGENEAWYAPYEEALMTLGIIPEWFEDYPLDQIVTREDVFALISNALGYIDR